MGDTLTYKLLKNHLVHADSFQTGDEISIRIDQTLTQDSTGTMAYLQLEALGISRVKTKKSVAYIDHNMLQDGFENADDHKYIQTVAKKHGIYFSRPGNGICHQVHLERMGIPGQSLLGSDSHTPTCGGLAMLAMGAGGLDVAMAMGGIPYTLRAPQVVGVYLKGSLPDYVSAKDIILEVLRRLTVKGGVSRIIEYTGEGVAQLSVPQRATICNMGAELGATTSVFPSDAVTKAFLTAQSREDDWVPLAADADCTYDLTLEIDLSSLTPLAAAPHSPDHIVPVSTLAAVTVDQVCIGSCTNSSYRDLMMAAAILKGKHIAEHVSLTISPGSRQVLQMLSDNGALSDLICAGARILECGCGPCIGMGQSPGSNSVSLRTFNRNFKGRSGTQSANVYLVSPETAAASAITGKITDPRTLGNAPVICEPSVFPVDDNMFIPPAKENTPVHVVRGPNIKPFPMGTPLGENMQVKVILKVEDHITTDHIMPSNAKLLPFRSNIPYLSDFCLTPCDPLFPARAKEEHGGIIVAGENYGQGSSREHAALVPLYLGVKAVIAKSFARIHKANLINAGILPMTFQTMQDYDTLALLDTITIQNIPLQMAQGNEIHITTASGNYIPLSLDVTEKEKEVLLCGGKINWLRERMG